MTATEPTTVITCDCKVCSGRNARVRGDGTHNGKPMTRTMRHNLVCLAHSPVGQQLARTASGQRFGPWPA